MKKLLLCICLAALVVSGCTSKPSKSSIEKSLKKVALESAYSDAPDDEKEKLDDYISCVVDDAYDDVSANSWDKIVKTKPDEDSTKNIPTKEKNALEDAANKCSDKLE